MKNEKRLKNRKKVKNIKKLFILILIVTIAIIFFVIKNKSAKLVGKWKEEGKKSYEFSGKGKGKLKLPTNEYAFSYTIKDNKIHLDFESNEAKDSDYEYSFEGDKLHLKGLNNYAGEYELTKQK